MTREYVTVKGIGLWEDLGDIAENSPEAETIYYLYVTDAQERLVGVVSCAN